MTIGTSAQVKCKLHKGRAKFTYESKSGLERRADGKGFVQIERVIDRENDLYKDLVVDPKTGIVLKHEEGSLKDHTGRVSARKETLVLRVCNTCVQQALNQF